MSCCGNKRKEWMNEVKSSIRQEETEVIPNVKNTEKPDKIFEYTGNHSLIVHGTTSGKNYHFRFKGEQIQIDHHDSFAFMAERDLKIVTTQQNEP